LDYTVAGDSVNSNWVTGAVWDISTGQHFQSGLMHSVLGGWQINGIFTIHSGYPFTVTSGLDNSFSGIGEDTGDLIGNPLLSSGRSRPEKLAEWFNTKAFTVNAIGTFGNTGINAFRGPMYWNLDTGLIKHFQINERFNGEFRSLFYNVFNHPNFSNPNGVVTSPTFGQITSTSADARVIEFAVRLSF
jgi:hypothetical protein